MTFIFARRCKACVFWGNFLITARKGIELGREGSSGSSLSPRHQKKTDRSFRHWDFGGSFQDMGGKDVSCKIRNLQTPELIQSPRRNQEVLRLLKIWVIHPWFLVAFLLNDACKTYQNLPEPPNILMVLQSFPGGGFKYVLFSPLCGEDSHFD